jgi:uncharacterized repeat protein (TIGR02543 family)
VLIEEGTRITLTALADPSSTFTGWSGSCAGTVSRVEVTMSGARSCTATFAPAAFTLGVTRSAGGRVTSSPLGIDCGADCTHSYAPGTLVTLTASPDAGFQFDGWSQDCSGTNPASPVVMDGDRSCHASFSAVPAQATLTVAVVKPAGSLGRIVAVSPPANPINCDGTGPVCQATFAPGTTVVVRPNDTSIELNLFGSWTGCDAVGGLFACTVTLNGSRTVTATFAR